MGEFELLLFMDKDMSWVNLRNKCAIIGDAMGGEALS